MEGSANGEIEQWLSGEMANGVLEPDLSKGRARHRLCGMVEYRAHSQLLALA